MLKNESVHFENYVLEIDKFLSVTIYSIQKGLFAVIIEDITTKKNHEQEREYLLSHDPLTGLNSRLFFEQQVVELDKIENLPLTVINFDINGLMIINEAYGFERGNQFLLEVAGILKDVFRENCTVSRVGGDQFAVIMVQTTKAVAEGLAREVANRVKSINVQGTHLSIAYGAATKEQDENIQRMLIFAENAMYSNKIFESQSYRNQSIQSLINAYHEKNPREEKHSHRVSELCEKFAQKLNLEHEDINKLKAISYLHDIGKIAIDEAILNKPGKLSDEEWKIIKNHPAMGARIISTSDQYAVIADDILAHHERFDGKGYPMGLAGEDIPLRARIIAIIDSYDAMVSDRPYRKALSQKEAIAELINCSGTQFDPELVDVFVREVIENH